jgi:hypothetical protein
MQREALSRHILPCSATMVGVCMTSIGLVKIIEEHIGPSHVDEYLALNSIVFLVSGALSYLSLRTSEHRLTARLEKIADLSFMTGLAALAIIATLFAYEAI